LEDVDVAGAPETIPFSPSNYNIQPDGRGTLNLTGSGPLSFSVTLLSKTEGLIVETDGGATTSGKFFLQDPSAFANGFNGNYIFDVSGIDFNQVAPDSIVGQLAAGSGILQGVVDENDNASPTGAQAITSGSFQIDAGNNTNFGRGTLTFTAGGIAYHFIYYVVTGTRLCLIEDESFSGALNVGTATAQSSVPTTNATFNGNFAFLTTGSG